MTNLTFTETNNPQQANVISVQIADLAGTGTFGLAYMPNPKDGDFIRSDVFVNMRENTYQMHQMPMHPHQLT